MDNSTHKDTVWTLVVNKTGEVEEAAEIVAPVWNYNKSKIVLTNEDLIKGWFLVVERYVVTSDGKV